MSEKPFKDEDVLWRWNTKDMIVGEYVMVEQPDKSILTYLNIKGHWTPCDWLGIPIAELLRQRNEAVAKFEALRKKVGQ